MAAVLEVNLHEIGIERRKGAIEPTAQARNGSARGSHHRRTRMRIGEPGAHAYRKLAHVAARELDLELAEGVYAGLKGPTYETPAEIRMMRDFGADAIGMSTVPEAIVARHSGMGILAISCITNTAAGLAEGEISHDQVIKIGEQAGRRLSNLIVRLAPRLAGLETAG